MRSDTVKKGFQRAPHRGLLHACGLNDADINKPFIGIANSFCEIVPGHVHLNKVGRIVKQAVRQAGGTAFEFNTIAVCDGIGRGHRGMSRPPVRDYKAPKAPVIFEYLGRQKVLVYH